MFLNLFAAISIIKTFEKAKICKQAVNIGLICLDHSKGQTKNKSKKNFKNKKICKQAVNFDLIYCNQDKNKTKRKGISK